MRDLAEAGNMKEYRVLTHGNLELLEKRVNEAMKNGWMWRIPVWGRWGNGYIFDDTLINSEQAKKEVEEVLGREIKVAKDIKFEAGALDKPWIGNCLAVGLCANFIEPLEATSIGTSINQMFMLMHHLENYEQTDIDDYNKKMNSVMESKPSWIRSKKDLPGGFTPEMFPFPSYLNSTILLLIPVS